VAASVAASVTSRVAAKVASRVAARVTSRVAASVAALGASAFAEASADQWGAGGWWLWAVFGAALATVAAIFVTMRRLYQVGCGNPWYLALYPLAVVVVLAFEAGALVRALGVGAVTWRGTTYKGGRVISGGRRG
jgi:hypothetical protein